MLLLLLLFGMLRADSVVFRGAAVAIENDQLLRARGLLLRLRQRRQLSALVVVCCVIVLLLLLLSLLLGLLESLLERLLFQYPVIHEVKVETFSHERFSEHRDDLLVIGSLFKLELARVVEEVPKLSREPMRQVFDRSNGLLDLDLFVLLLFCLGRQALPGQSTLDKVHQHHADLFQVVPSGLLDAHMSVETGVSSSACQLLVVFVADVAARARVLIPLGQSKVDDVDDMLVVAHADQEIVRLNISV